MKSKKVHKKAQSKKWFAKTGMIVCGLSILGLIFLIVIGYDHQVKTMARGGDFDKFSAGTIALFSILMLYLVITNIRNFKD